MSEYISNNAMIYAILALDGEISLQKDYLDSGDVVEDERDDEEGVLSDLEQALMEFIEAYKKRASADKNLPKIEDLLSPQAWFYTASKTVQLSKKHETG